jgi:hypothetical protein
MPFYEYKVVPAPERAPKVRGLKGASKFAHALQEIMNTLAQEGWEYQRADSLPDEEKKGLMGGRETVTRNVLVFRRELYFEEAAPEETVQPGTETAPEPPRDQTDEAVEEGRDAAREDSEPPAPETAPEPEDAPDADRVPVFSRRPLVADR